MSVVHHIGRMFSSKKILLLPHRWGWYFLEGEGRGWVVHKPKKRLEKCTKLNRNFQRGGGVGVS